MRGRAFRRRQWERAKARAARYLGWVYAGLSQRVTAQKVVRHAVDRTPCSCPKCGNPRRWTGDVTRQELLTACQCEEPDAEPAIAGGGSIDAFCSWPTETRAC
jgi:hypothetical protein